MKQLNLLVLACLCGLFMVAFQLDAQAISFVDDDDFHDDQRAIWDGNTCTFSDDEEGVDYIFLADAGGVNQFTVQVDELLEIDYGVTIWLDEDVELIIEGQMTNSGDDDGQIVIERRTVNEVERDAWYRILIKDSDLDEDPNDVGNITLDNAVIRGGGSGNLENGCDWRGLIVIDGAGDSHPVLDLTDCVLGYSLHNGIVAKSNGNPAVTTINLTGCTIGYSAIENIIQDSGIKLGDENETEAWMDQQDPPPEMDLEAYFTANEVHSFNCGLHGFFCFDGGGEYYFDDCNFSENGQNDGENAEGNGIYFLNHLLGESGCAGDNANFVSPETIIDIETTLIEQNNRDGIRLKESEATVVIHADTCYSNGQRGIYYDYSCHTGLGRVEENVVHENGWEGIAAFKGGDFQAAIWILGNDVLDNATADLPDNIWQNSHERCANIRLHGHFGNAEQLILDADVERPLHGQLLRTISSLEEIPEFQLKILTSAFGNQVQLIFIIISKWKHFTQDFVLKTTLRMILYGTSRIDNGAVVLCFTTTYSITMRQIRRKAVAMEYGWVQIRPTMTL